MVKVEKYLSDIGRSEWLEKYKNSNLSEDAFIAACDFVLNYNTMTATEFGEVAKRLKELAKENK